MARENVRTFSLGWVFVSYFIICGGMVVSLIAFAATVDHWSVAPENAAYFACGLGGLVGGFFAGRASTHYSALEPAIAGALIVGSVYLLLTRTAIGPIAFAFAEQRIEREGLILGALLSAGGLVGALVGEATVRGPRSLSPVRWFGLGVLITYGAALAATILTNILLIDQALRDPALVRRILDGGELISANEVSSAFLAALAGTGFVGGLVTQMAAGRRMLLVSTSAVFAALTGGMLAVLGLADAIDADTIAGSLFLGGCATMLGLIGAVISWLYSRIVGTTRQS